MRLGLPFLATTLAISSLAAAYAEPPSAHVSQIAPPAPIDEQLATKRDGATPLDPPDLTGLAAAEQLPAGVSERAAPDVIDEAGVIQRPNTDCGIDDETLRAVAEAPDRIELLAEPCNRPILGANETAPLLSRDHRAEATMMPPSAPEPPPVPQHTPPALGGFPPGVTVQTTTP